MRFRNSSIAVMMLATAARVLAAETTSAGATAGGDATASGATAAEPSEIVVTGQREEYGVRSTSTATRTNTAVKDIPQALTVISEQQIEDQQFRSIADVLMFVPGATPGTGEANRDQITLRGNNTTADFFVNGIRDDVQYFRDLYNVDRIEVLRGPNAMIFGRGGGGGIVNRVTKRSSLSPYREFAGSIDSEGGYRLTGDIDQPLGAGLGVRVNGVYENGESFRRHIELERYGVNPTIGLVAGPDTRIDVGYEYFHDRRTTDRGVPARDGRPIDGFDTVFFGDPELSFAKADVHVGTIAVEHKFSDSLTLRNRTLLGRYDKFYQNVFPSALAAPQAGETGDQVALGAYNSRNDRTNLFNQLDLIWEGRIGGIDQTLLLGFEVGRQKSRNLRLSGTFAGGDNRFPLADPTIDADVTFAPAPSDADNRTRATVAALYIQDQIRISPMLEIVAGLRFDRFKLAFDDLRPGRVDFSRTDETISPRLGLIAKPMTNLSLYANYSRSFLPQSGDQFGGLDVNTDALKPERFDNYEVGAKWEPLEGLLATVALYRLDRTNTRAIDPTDPTRFVLTGEQRSKGVEIGLERSVSDRWLVSAGYAYQKAEIRSRTTACDPDAASCAVALVPRHSFSLWNRYDLTDQLGIGLGVIARSKSYASIGNTVRLPGYARIDAAAFYDLGRGIKAQLNVENILGEDYFPTAHSDNNIAPGAPRTARATVRFGF
jgi:catecholate siderophore receptor